MSPDRTVPVRPSPKGARRGVIAFALAGALVLAACGGGGDDDDAVDGSGGDRPGVGVDEANGGVDQTSDEADGDGTEGGDQALQSGEANSYLPFDAEAPAGYRSVADECEAQADGGDDDAPTKYTSPIGWAVPTGWTSGGRSSGGSGGVLGTDVDLRFTTEDGDRITIGYEWDTHGPDNVIHDYNGDPWKTFDYDSSIGDDKARIVYDSVSMVTIGDQEVELFHLDPNQAPEHVSSVEYKARVRVMEIIDPKQGPRAPSESSFVFTISFDTDGADVSQEAAESVVGSLSMPTCQWDDLIVNQEMYRGIDLNGDGEIKSIEDAQAEMQANLDEMLAEQEAELEAELEGN